MPGYKYNMMDLQAAIGLHQLARLEAHLHARARRSGGCTTRRSRICRSRGRRRSRAATCHARHLYTILVDPESGWSRDGLMARAARGRHLDQRALSRAAPAFRSTPSGSACARGMFPDAELVSDRTLSLPLSAGMTDGEVAQVIGALRSRILRNR